jgi:hypothetical protein
MFVPGNPKAKKRSHLQIIAMKMRKNQTSLTMMKREIS